MQLTTTNYLPSYTVGEDAYKAVPEVTKRFGTRAVVVGGEKAMQKGGPRLRAALEGTDVQIVDFIWYGGQASHAAAAEIAKDSRVLTADMIFGMGGGRAVDEAKEIAEIAGKPIFTFPTLASNCAPVSGIGVFYKDDGSLDNYFFPSAPPIHCFIDTKVIAESPNAYFWAGIGDALSKEPEVELATRDLFLPHTPLMGRALAECCDKPLFDYSRRALADKYVGRVTPEFEQVVLDIIISTGLVSNMTTNMGVKEGAYYYNSSVAHAFYNAYTGIGEEAERHLHGEVVSFGVLVLMAFDDRPEDLARYAELNQALGLPVTLEQIECPVRELDGIVKRAQTTNEWGRAPYGYTPARFLQAILDADAYGRALRMGNPAAMAACKEAVHRNRCVEPAERKL